MTLKEKIDFIDDFLARCEDWMHDEDGEDVTKCRKLLIDIEAIKNTQQNHILHCNCDKYRVQSDVQDFCGKCGETLL